jgi:hypothetical protein
LISLGKISTCGSDRTRAEDGALRRSELAPVSG